MPILMSGYSEKVTRESAASLGAAALLEKPITLEDLHAAMRHALH